MGKPILISENCFGISNHSGGNSIVTSDDKYIYIVFVEIANKSNRQNPTYIVKVSKSTRKIISKKLIDYVNLDTPDIHASPVIALDNKNNLHVIIGSHNKPFKYAFKNNNKLNSKWSIREYKIKRQTYASLLINKENVKYLLYRNKTAKTYLRLNKLNIIKQPINDIGYGNFYHRFFIDRLNRIFISYAYINKEKKYYLRKLIFSNDNGLHWKYVNLKILQQGINSENPNNK